MIKKGFILYTPMIVFTIIWGVTLSLYLLNPYQLNEIRMYTWVVILLGLSMVYLGFFTSRFLSDEFVVPKTILRDDGLPFSIESLKKFIIIFTTISLAGKIGANYLIFAEIGSFEQYFVNPAEVRTFIKETGMGNTSVNLAAFKLFSNLGSYTPIMCMLAGAIANEKKTRLLSLYPLLVAALSSVMTLQRAYFIKAYVIWLICSFIIIYYYPSLKQKQIFKQFFKRIFTFLFISLFFMFIVVFLRSLFIVTTDTQKLYDSFYIYIAGNIFLLDKYLVNDPGMLYGASLFRSLIKWFAAFGIMEKADIIHPHYEFHRIYNTWGNTFTYLRMIYDDFQLIGVIIVSYIWGWFGFFSMKKYFEKFSFVRFGLAALIILSFFWSFYGFNLIHITAWVWKLFLLSIIDKLYLRKRA